MGVGEVDHDRTAQDCRIDRALEPDELAQLDELMADPSRWPDVVWGILGKPAKLTPAARKFGAVEMGFLWLHNHFPLRKFDKPEVVRHYRLHVSLVEATLIRYAKVATGNDLPGGVGAVIEFYEQGIQLGIRSLRTLKRQLDDAEANGETVPPEMLLQLATAGARLSASAASLSKRSPFELPAVGNAGFRRNVPSQRIGHSRVHVIDGQAMPIRDEGHADRLEYNERAAMDATEGIG
jgi:hypothetical protein